MKTKITFLLFFFYLTSNLVLAQTNTTIFDIARKGTLKEVQDLCKSNKSAINSIDDNGYSPLILACYRGNNEVASWLIKNGADINFKSGLGTPLMAAIVKGNNEMAKLLIEQKANIDISDSNGTTALIYATNFKNYEIVSLLIKTGADYNKEDNRGNSALEYAILMDDDKLIETLKNKKI